MEFSSEIVSDKFRSLFVQEPLVIYSPGRINLIGEHTDYNNGFVMPAAIDKGITFALARSNDSSTIIYSLLYDEFVEVDLSSIRRTETPRWANYLLGVLYQLVEKGYAIKPFRCTFGGNIPMGAGLSSSAALECGFAYGLNELYSLEIEKTELVRIAQWSEHHFVGVLCGIMDQFASVMGKENSVIMLDCRSLAYQYLPFSLAGYSLLLCDTKVKHSLVDSEYNTRRQECEQGVAILNKYYPEVKSLRDATMPMIVTHKAELRGKIYDRCLFIVSENQRVLDACDHLRANDIAAFGALMFDAHLGLSSLYEVSCAELDFLVDFARSAEGVAGARMMGGGFGGCTINIVEENRAEAFQHAIRDAFKNQFGIDTEIYAVRVEEGTRVLSQPERKLTGVD